MGYKPGWTRVSFSYSLSEEEVAYVISSIEWVANYGYHLLPMYDFDWKTANWTCKDYPSDIDPFVLRNIIGGHLNNSKFLQRLLYKESETRQIGIEEQAELLHQSS